MTDSVPAPMVQIPAETVEQLREALDQIPAAPVEREGLYPTLYWAARAVLDAATPAASVPAADILALAEHYTAQDGIEYPLGSVPCAEVAERLRALVAAAEQADKGEAAEPPRDDETIKCPTCGVARGWNEDGRLTRGIWTFNCVECGSFQIEIEDAPAAPPDPSADSVNASVHRATRGGYTSNKQVGDLAPPPKGPAPGARVPVNDEAEAEMAWLGWEEGEKGPTTWARLHAAFLAGFRAARGEDA